VQDGDPDLALELVRVGERGQERTAIDDDFPGQRARRRSICVRIPDEAAEDRRAVRALLLDHDCDVLERLRDVFGKRVERGSDVLVELFVRHHYLGNKRYGTISASSAFWACRRFSASSQTAEWGPYRTSSVISSPQCAGRQWSTIASGLACESSWSS